MKLIIDIPEKDYKQGTLANVFRCYSRELDNIIYNGTVLPEGHGKLIDVNEVKKKYPLEIDGLDLRGNNQCLHTAMDEAPAVIEADNGVEDN